MHILSSDNMSIVNHTRAMPKRMTPARYRETFCARLKNLRESAGMTQKELARELGIDKDTYAKYESRSLLPHHLIMPVCEILGVDAAFLVSGQGNTSPKTTPRPLPGRSSAK